MNELAERGPWFHSINYGDLVVERDVSLYGGDPQYPRPLLERIEPYLPDLTEMRVLDVGCNAGFFLVETARRGAKALGIEPIPHFVEQARYVRARVGLEYEVVEDTVYNASRYGRFDVVLFLGVIYHLRNPLAALDELRKVVRGTMIVESALVSGPSYVVGGQDAHAMAFASSPIGGAEAGFNWFIPSFDALKAMLLSAGFTVINERAYGDRGVVQVT